MTFSLETPCGAVGNTLEKKTGAEVECEQRGSDDAGMFSNMSHKAQILKGGGSDSCHVHEPRLKPHVGRQQPACSGHTVLSSMSMVLSTYPQRAPAPAPPASPGPPPAGSQRRPAWAPTSSSVTRSRFSPPWYFLNFFKARIGPPSRR